MMNDDFLIEQCKRRHQPSMEALYCKYAPSLRATARKYLADTAQAMDFVHDAFITAFESMDKFKGKGSFEGWIKRIMINRIIDHLKKNSRPFWIDATDGEQQESSSYEILLSGEFSTEEVLLCLTSLPEVHRLVFNLYVLENYSHAEIAEKLGITVGTSKSYLSRAREKLVVLLAEKARQMEREKEKKYLAVIPVFGLGSGTVDEYFKYQLSSLSEPLLENEWSQFMVRYQAQVKTIVNITLSRLNFAMLMTGAVFFGAFLFFLFSHFFNRESPMVGMSSDNTTLDSACFEKGDDCGPSIADQSDHVLRSTLPVAKTSVLPTAITYPVDTHQGTKDTTLVESDLTEFPSAGDVPLQLSNEKSKEVDSLPPVVVIKKIIVRDTIKIYKKRKNKHP